MIVVRVLTGDDWADWRALRLAALGDAPHAFGSTLADWQGEADAEARWRARLDNVSLNLLADLDEKPAGMVSGMLSDDGRAVELLSMWVAPFARGRGVGDVLVQAVVGWSDEHGADRVVLQVAEDNRHAVTLYRRHGFTDRTSVEDGSGVREMVRSSDESSDSRRP